jgi:hypothetical protein
VERSLALARTWLAWDGRSLVAEDGGRIYTPNKAVRRTCDHYLDHLAEVEALLAGAPTEPDAWHASNVTLAADLASFTEADLNEAEQRLRRIALIWRCRLNSLTTAELAAPRGLNRRISEIVEHVASSWYAEQVGDLSRPSHS